MIRLVLAAVLWLTATAAGAHETRPAFLEIVETAPDLYRVTWKQPALLEGVLALEPALPAACVDVGPRSREAAPGALVSRWSARCAGGLKGTIRIGGLERTMTSAFVRIAWMNGRVAEGLVDNNHPTFEPVVRAAPAPTGYFGLGVTHILLGFDHLGFVAGLMLLVRRRRALAWSLTAFTLAHSLTLGLAAFGLAALPPRLVEILIALSIVLVAWEGLRARGGAAGLSARIPWAVAFGFGLLHGFGFAGALSEIGLPQGQRLAALLFFNLGVEAGQFAVVGALWILALLAARLAPRATRRVPAIGGYALGALGVFWVFERLAG